MGEGAAMGAGAGSLLAPWQNPSDAANPSMNKIPGYLQQYLIPYIQAGQNESPQLQQQYGNLMNNPGQTVNAIGSQYHQSPGFNFAMQQALQGSNHAAAAGGMAGSPQHEQQNMGVATGLANQDYNQWLTNALGEYNTGLSGAQGMYNTGAQTGTTMGEDMAGFLAQKAKLAYEGANSENEHQGGGWGSLLGGAAGVASAFL